MDKRPPMYYPPIYPGSQPQYPPTLATQSYPPQIYYMPMSSFPYQYPPYPGQYFYKNPSVPGPFAPRNTYNKPRRLSNQGGGKPSFVPKVQSKPPASSENPEGKVLQRIKPEAREGCNERKLSDNIKKARFFIIKSYEKEHIKEAIRSGIWTSTQKGNQKLNDAFQEAKNEFPIILLFSVNNSGFFQGVAEMSSEVFFDKYYEGWNQPKKWMGVIDIKWLFLKDVVNKSLKHISNPLNEGKPIPNSRDTQEIPFDAGVQVLKIFEETATESKFLSEVLKRD